MKLFSLSRQRKIDGQRFCFDFAILYCNVQNFS